MIVSIPKQRFVFHIVILFLLTIVCSSLEGAICPNDKSKEEITCPDNDKNNPNKLTFLFAHGLNGFPMEWQYFSDRVKAQGFGVWRTQVKKKDIFTKEELN